MSDRKAALDMALKQIEKQFGKGSVMKLGENSDRKIETSSSGSIAIDAALGVGGYPRGRIVEVYGPESSGKTTVTLHAIAEIQKNGGTAAFIDAEHALDPLYAQKLGVNIDELLLAQPDTGEQALEIAEALVRSGAIDIIVIDSVAATAGLSSLLVQRVLSLRVDQEEELHIQRHNLFHMFLIVKDCRVLTIIDSGSCNNLVSSDLVDKFGLPTRQRHILTSFNGLTIVVRQR